MKTYKIIILLIFCMFLFCVSCQKKAPMEKEPNNSFSAATEIALKKPVKGYFDSRDDQDYYKLEITEESVLTIQLSGLKGVNHAIKIFTHNANPQLLKQVDDNRKSSPESIANLYAKPGTYFICILHGIGDKIKANKETPYTLTVTSRSPGTEEKEPNDTILSATEIKVNEEITGYFSPAKNRLFYNKDFLHREEDWYKVRIDLDAEKPALVTINLSEVPSVNSMLYLYDSNKNMIASVDKKRSGQPESLEAIGITKSGDYYVVVTTKNYNDNMDTPYYMRVSLSEHDPSTELEVNNSFKLANLVIKNQITGKINDKDDHDIFLYKANNETIEYRVELEPSADLDLQLTLYDRNQKKITVINNSGKGIAEIHPNIRLTGNFFVKVSSKLSAVQQENSYTLNITPTEMKQDSETEPNDTQKNADKINNTATGYISKKRDIDYYVLEYQGFTQKTFLVHGVKGGKIQVSITDPFGNIIKSKKIIGNRKLKIKEMINKKGYIIIKALSENYNNPYRIEIRGDK